RLNGADLVVGKHHAHQNRPRPDRSGHVVRIDEAVAADLQIGDLVSLRLEAFAGVEHGLVLDRGRDDVIAFVFVEVGGALDRQVVALGGAARQDYLFAVYTSDDAGDPLASRLDRFFRLPPELVTLAGGVAELRRKVGEHLLDDALVHRRRRVVIHENGQL